MALVFNKADSVDDATLRLAQNILRIDDIASHVPKMHCFSGHALGTHLARSIIRWAYDVFTIKPLPASHKRRDYFKTNHTGSESDNTYYG